MKPDTLVRLVNKGKKDFVSMWDSKEFVIQKGKYKDVVYGLAEHFMQQSADLAIDEIPIEPVKPRKVVNPLDEKNRGAAFAELE